MSRDKVREPIEGVDELQERLAVWRQIRVSGQAMPEELWTAAADLARKHSVFAAARSLGLEFNKLKAYVEGRVPGPKKRAAPRHPKRRESDSSSPAISGFMELDASQLFGEPAGATEAVVELLNADGARMRISLRGRAAVDLPGVVAAFARRG